MNHFPENINAETNKAYMSFLKHSKEHITACVERKTYKQYETQI